MTLQLPFRARFRHMASPFTPRPMKATVLMSMACSCVSQADNELKIKQHAGGSLPPGKFWNVLSIGPFRGLRREALSFQGAPLDALEGREYESPTRIRPGSSIESRFSTDPGRQAQAAQM